MMSDTISLTIPLQLVALRAGARMLEELAADVETRDLLDRDKQPLTVVTPLKEVLSKLPPVQSVTLSKESVDSILDEVEPDPASVFAKPNTTTLDAIEELDNGGGEVVSKITDGVITPTSDVKFDKDGLPWDERIHAGSRAINADGRWRKRKNIPEQLIATVETELRAVNAANVTAAAVPPAPVVPVAVVPTAPVVPVAPIVPAPSSQAATVWTFPSILRDLFTPNNATGKITSDKFLEITNKYGIATLPMLKHANQQILDAVAVDILEHVK